MPKSTGLGSALYRAGPRSNAAGRESMDGRTREARLLRQVRAELTEHVGGRPSVTQRALIERAARLSLYVSQLDRKVLGGEAMSAHDSKSYLATSNSLCATLRLLGLKAQEATTHADEPALAAP